MPTLQQLGWTSYFEQHIDTSERQGLTVARVTEEQRERYLLLNDAGEIHAEVSGRIRHAARGRADFPAVGDWVMVQAAGPGQGIVQRVLPRMTCLSRKAPGRESEEQILAANVDIVFVTSSLNRDFNPRRIERALALVHDSGALPVILLTKADLCSDPASPRASLDAVARGIDVLIVSALEQKGLEPVRDYVAPGQTAVLLGSSGVGKSTLINALSGTGLLETGPVRADDDRGRHTTSHRQLIPLAGGGMVIDTPGLREIQLWTGEESLDATFEDIAGLAASCRFGDCRHTTEPGCAVLAALQDGTLAEQRLANYRKLQSELAYLHRREDKAAQAAERKRWRQINSTAHEHIQRKRRIDL